MKITLLDPTATCASVASPRAPSHHPATSVVRACLDNGEWEEVPDEYENNGLVTERCRQVPAATGGQRSLVLVVSG